MNVRISLLAATLVAVTPAALVAQGAFEGVITFETNAGPAGERTMQYSIKGDKIRMDMSAQGMEMFTLFDVGTKTMDMVMPSRQMYIERQADASAMSGNAGSQPKIDWTGQKETIAGVECEHANITGDDGTTTDVCLAQGLGPFMRMQGGFGAPGGRMGRGGAMGRGGRGGGMRGGGAGMGGGWEGHIGQAFPLKVTRDGTVELQVTKIEKKSLDDSLFKIPDGYQKMGMPGGMPYRP